MIHFAYSKVPSRIYTFMGIECLSAPAYVEDPGHPKGISANMISRSITRRESTIHEVGITMDGLDD